MLGTQTSIEKRLLSKPGLQQIQTDPDVRREETLLIERGFPRPLNPDEDHAFHHAPSRSPVRTDNDCQTPRPAHSHRAGRFCPARRADAAAVKSAACSSSA